jgi:hypothetical protein
MVKNKQIHKKMALQESLQSKKMILVTICISLFLCGFVGAADFDNVKDYDDKVALGKITISNFFGLEKLAEYTLTKNTFQCLTECYAEGNVVLYDDETLFDSIKFEKIGGASTSINSYKFFIEQTDEYIEEVPSYKKVCNVIDINETRCNNEIASYTKVTKYNTYWKEYNGEVLSAGSYNWRIEGKKQSRESVDWIVTTMGKDLTEWAWWDSDWKRRKEITITGGKSTIYNFTAFFRITYDSEMNASYDDLRFLDSVDNELKCDLEAKNSTTANVWCRIPTLNTGSNTFYMYYNNTNAAPSWNSNETWKFGSGAVYSQIYHLTKGNVSGSDSAGNYDIYSTNVTTSYSVHGIFGNATLFNQSIYLINQTLNSTKFTLLFLGNVTVQNNNDVAVGADIGGGGLDAGDWKIVYDTTSEKMQYDVEGDAVYTSNFTAVTPGSWYYYAVVYNGTTVKTYLNGIIINTIDVAYGISGLTSIGGYWDGVNKAILGWANWSGMIDEVWFLNNIELNNDTIERYYNQTDFSLVTFGVEEIPIVNVNIIYPSTNGTTFINPTTDINYTLEDYGNTIESCWYSNDTFLVNKSITCGTNITNILWSIGIHSVKVYANITTGEESYDQIDFFFDTIFETGVSYDTPTLSGASSKFGLNVSYDSNYYSSILSYLVYNNTRYAASGTGSFNNYYFEKTITIPVVSAKTDVTFYWETRVYDGSSWIIQNSSFYNQTINTVGVDNCSKYDLIIYNYTLYDEKTKEKISNTTIEVQMSLYDLPRANLISNYSYTFNEVNPIKLCFNGTILPKTYYSFDSTVKYWANDTTKNISYAIETYNVLNSTLSNSSYFHDIKLYDLNNEDSTAFQLTFRDNSYSLKGNVLVYLYRQYVGDGDFKVVEVPITDSNGQTILHMVRNDVIYNIVFVDVGGKIVAAFNKITAFCQDYTIGSCEIFLNAPLEEESIYDFDDEFGITYTGPDYINATKTVTFSYVFTNLSEKTVKMEVIKDSGFNNRSICTDEITSAAGTLSCDVTDWSTNSRYLFINIYVDGEQFTTIQINLESSQFTFGTAAGAFYAFLLIILLISIFSYDKQALVISLGIGWVVVIGLGLISGKIIGSLTGGIWFIICIIIFAWKLNKEERGT